MSESNGQAPASHPTDRITFAEVLDRLDYEVGNGEFLSVGYRPVGRGFRTVVRSPQGALRFVFGDLLGPYAEFDCDVYFSINSIGGDLAEGRRGEERDVVRWRALYGDFDIKPGAFRNIDAALACIAAVSAMLGTRPSVIIFSGHGVQPIWAIEDGQCDTTREWERAARLSRRFGRLVEVVAWRNHQAGVDSVFDLSRLLRCPNTFNRKDPRHIVLARYRCPADDGPGRGAPRRVGT
jgi:hypothetical protein